MKTEIDKDFILHELSYIIEILVYLDEEEMYEVYKKSKITDYKSFLKKELIEEDYSEFLDGYNKILIKYNMPLNEYDDDFECKLHDEQAEYCSEFSLHILDKYVTNKSLVRERNINKILNIV